MIQVDGEHDLFGDACVVCLPTYGHMPGHQSLRVRLPSGNVVLAADACYFCRTLRERRLPQRAYDRQAMSSPSTGWPISRPLAPESFSIPFEVAPEMKGRTAAIM